MADRNDRIRIVNVETGDALDVWESAEVSSDYLTPCDTFRFDAGSEAAPIEIARRFPPGKNVIVSAVLHEGREAVLLDGYIDIVDMSSDRGSGRRLMIEGRDFLSQVVDSNVDPRRPPPGQPTIEQVNDFVLKGMFNIQYEITEENVKTHEAIGPRLKKRPPTRPSRRSRKQPANQSIPRDNEGAWQFLARMNSDHGYWLSAGRTPERRYAILAGPNYNQDSHYSLRLLRGPAGAANNVIRSSLRVDESSVPSHVYVKGSGFGTGDRAGNVSMASNRVASRLKPAFVVDQKAKTKESTERIARMLLGKQIRNYITYHATVQGIVDEQTGALFAADTMVDVRDDDMGLIGPMWVESCTIRKSRKNGTTTELKLIPPGTLVLDWQPDEDIDKALEYVAAYAESLGVKSAFDASTIQYNGVEIWNQR
ncbi:MAG: hypothetical protein MUF34_32645 [Polyangiaceae bacterium]|jgi:prophage tail gpP-like protein|nr:hypothetical protein [Polyangiaceae bacterium]